MSTATVESRRGRGETAERILDAAERLFGERGYAGTSLRAIAAGVGIQNPSLYKHFSSKASLYDAVLERAFLPVLFEFWDSEDEVERVVRHFAEHPHVAQLMLRETAAGQSAPTASASRWLKAVVARTADWLPNLTGVDPAAISLRVLAVYHVVAGHAASSATHRMLTGSESDSNAVLEEQTRIVIQMAEALFATLGQRAPSESP